MLLITIANHEFRLISTKYVINPKLIHIALCITADRTPSSAAGAAIFGIFGRFRVFTESVWKECPLKNKTKHPSAPFYADFLLLTPNAAQSVTSGQFDAAATETSCI